MCRSINRFTRNVHDACAAPMCKSALQRAREPALVALFQVHARRKLCCDEEKKRTVFITPSRICRAFGARSSILLSVCVDTIVVFVFFIVLYYICYFVVGFVVTSLGVRARYVDPSVSRWMVGLAELVRRINVHERKCVRSAWHASLCDDGLPGAKSAR